MGPGLRKREQTLERLGRRSMEWFGLRLQQSVRDTLDTGHAHGLGLGRMHALDSSIRYMHVSNPQVQQYGLAQGFAG